MDPHIYPDPQTEPLNVSAKVGTTPGTSGLKAIEENSAIDQASSLRIMWIRVAKVGPSGSNPIIRLKADTGDETQVKTSSTVSIWNQPGDTGTEVANAIMLVEANGVYLVKVFLFATGSTWQIRIDNDDVVARNFTWVVASTDALSRQPWIDLPTTLEYDVLPGQPVPLNLGVANKGTGPLTINDTVGTSVGSDFTLTNVPASIPPNNGANLTITFKGQSASGASNTLYTVTSNDTVAQLAAGHNKRVNLKATTRKLEVVLVLDASGSMSRTPAGVWPAPSDDKTRWSKLQTAVGLLLDLLADFGSGMGRFGIAVFPNVTISPVPASSAGDVQVGIDITQANIDSAKIKLSDLLPYGGTPMGDGIAQGMGPNSLSFGYFLSDANSKQFNRRWMVLMSDGAHNEGPPEPKDFFGTGTGRSFRDKAVKVITVAYGEPSASEVDHVLLNKIATDSNGDPLSAGIDDVGTFPDPNDPTKTLTLQNVCIKAIAGGLSLVPISDPGGRLTATASEARYPITITPYDTKVAFVVNWNTYDAQRINVQLLTPNCELITPSVAQADPNIEYSSSTRYQIYTINSNYLSNSTDPSQPRYGTWTLIISGNSFSAGDQEGYEFNVITDSRIKLSLSTSHLHHYAGDPIELSARLTVDGVPLLGAAVVLHLNAPGQSVVNWLAFNPVTTEEMENASKAIGISDVTAFTVKAYALNSKGIFFNPFARPDTITMTYDQNSGSYKATISDTETPELYDFYVTAVGQTTDGIAFRREQRLQARVEVRPDPDFTWLDISYRLVNEAVVASIRAIPRDRFGNVILVDPVINPIILLTASGGEFTGPIVGNLDGSYTRTLRFSPGALPTIGLDVGGEMIIKDRPAVPVQNLRYVDRLVSFKIGGEAERGANQHTNPQAALGDITRKEPGTFVSLGASGTLSVGMEGQFILPEGDDDVTVFVQPDESLRPYLVEVLLLGSQSWVKLGESPGVTQSFSLSRLHILAATAIRITDKSGRARRFDLKPSATPGVSILGVGVKKAGAAPEETGNWWKWLLRLIRMLLDWLFRRRTP